MEVGLERLGLLPDQFWSLTWRELDYLIKHYEQSLEVKWDIARTLGSWSIAPHINKRIKPQDLFKLPSESRKKQVKQIPTIEEFEAHLKALNG